jgi:CheY-like chemotaxis protein
MQESAENLVLFVEDSPEDVDLVLATFKRWGMTNPVQVVGDGEQAMDYLTGRGVYADRSRYPFPGLVLLDLLLPKVSGLALLQWIRSQAAFSTLPVVVLTGSKNLDDIDQAYHFGANACAAKSLGLPELQDLLQHLNYFALASDHHTSEVEWFPET